MTAPDETKAGIFILTWVETLNYGFATGDADPLRVSVALGCFTCDNWIIEVQDQRNQHLTRQGGYVHVHDLVYTGSDAGDFLFRARLDRDAGVVVSADGGTKTAIQPGSDVVDVRVGLVSSQLSNTTAWTVKSVAPPSG